MSLSVKTKDILKTGAAALMTVTLGAAVLPALSTDAYARGGGSSQGGQESPADGGHGETSNPDACGGCGGGSTPDPDPTPSDNGGHDGSDPERDKCEIERIYNNGVARVGQGNRTADRIDAYVLLNDKTSQYLFGGAFLKSTVWKVGDQNHVNYTIDTKRKMEQCAQKFGAVVQGPGAGNATITTGSSTHITAGVTSTPVVVYRPNTYVTTKRGGQCEGAEEFRVTLKNTTPASVRVNPFLTVGEDYSQFSPAEIEAQNTCERVGVVRKDGDACTFTMDDVLGGEAFAEGRAECAPFVATTTVEVKQEEVKTPVTETQTTTTGQCVAVTAQNYFGTDATNINGVLTVDVKGQKMEFDAKQYMGVDCDNNRQNGLSAYATGVFTDVTVLMAVNENNQYANLSAVHQYHGKVVEATCEADAVVQMCTAKGYTLKP